jgi:hypothetical protein
MIRSIPSEDLWVLGLSIAGGVGVALAVALCGKYAVNYRSNPSISTVAKKKLAELEKLVQSSYSSGSVHRLYDRNCFVSPNRTVSQEEEELSLKPYTDLYFSDSSVSEEGESLLKIHQKIILERALKKIYRKKLLKEAFAKLGK